MVVFIILFILAIVWMIWVGKAREKNKITKDEARVSMMFPILLLSTFLGLQFIVSDSDFTTSEHTETREIQAATLIGGGRAESTEFNYIDKETKELKSVDASKSVVLEDDFKTDTVEITYRKIDNIILRVLFSWHGHKGAPETYIFKIQNLHESRVDY